MSHEADRRFASVLVEVAEPAPVSHPEPCVGVDLGITTLATLSTGETIPGPRAHKALLGRLRRTSRGLSRKRKGSANQTKAQRRLARLHARIASIRRDPTHKATEALARRFARIGVENLNMRGMARNRSLARSVMEGAFGEFRRQLEYKAQRAGALVVVADRFYPSSETCSCCGRQKGVADRRRGAQTRCRVTPTAHREGLCQRGLCQSQTDQCHPHCDRDRSLAAGADHLHDLFTPMAGQPFFT